MPRNIKAGTSPRKTRACPFPSCESRPRGGKPWKKHLQTVHGIQDLDEWFRVQFIRYTQGLTDHWPV